MWHSFADRRKEFDLPLFSKKDTGQLLGRLSNELQQPIESSLRRLLSEHCQGYPWLLKKLCVHVFQVLQTQPARQRELLERALDVEALFKKDLSDLDATQIACLEQIAKDSPADHFRIIEAFGEPTVLALMQLRLVMRSSGKLVVYWDIFRDYVLKKQVPFIPMQYIPGSSPGLVKTFLQCLTSRNNTQLSELSVKLNLKISTLDNIARDLVMMGICQYDRKNAKLKLVHSIEHDTLVAGHRFFSSHALLRKLVDQFGIGFRGISLKTIEATLSSGFSSKEYTKKTIDTVTTRLVLWLQAFGIVTINIDETLNHNQSNISITEYSQLGSTRRKSRDIQIFKGTAPPNRVIETLKALQNKDYKVTPQDRNSLYVLKSLGIISSTTEPKLLSTPEIGNEDIFLLGKVILQPSIRACRAVLKNNSNATSIEIGEAISNLNPSVLSEASKQRYGSGLFVWVSWIHRLIIDKTEEYS